MLHLYANNALIDTTLGCAACVYMYGFSVDLPLVIGGFGGIRSGTTEIVGTSLISMTLEVPIESIMSRSNTISSFPNIPSYG